MKPSYIPLPDKLHLFSNMIHTCHNLYVSVFDSESKLIHTNAPDSFPLDLTFHFCRNSVTYDYGSGDYNAYLLTYLNLTWIIVPVYDDSSLAVLGPCFMGHYSHSEFLDALSRHTLSISVKQKIDKPSHAFLCFPSTRIMEYTRCCII